MDSVLCSVIVGSANIHVTGFLLIIYFKVHLLLNEKMRRWLMD